MRLGSRVVLLGLAALLLGCAGDDATRPGRRGLVLYAERDIAAGELPLHVTLDGRPVGPVDFIVEGGPAHGRVDEDGVFHVPDPLPEPPVSRVTVRTRTEPPREDSILLPLEACGWGPGKVPCALQAHRDDGKRVRLDGYAGTLILLRFTATWCGPCRLAATHAAELDAELRARLPGPFTQIDLLLDDPPVSTESWAAHYDLRYPVLAMDSTDIARNGPLGIGGVPTCVFITPDFRVRRRVVGVAPNDRLVGAAQEAWDEYEAERRGRTPAAPEK